MTIDSVIAYLQGLDPGAQAAFAVLAVLLFLILLRGLLFSRPRPRKSPRKTEPGRVEPPLYSGIEDLRASRGGAAALPTRKRRTKRGGFRFRAVFLAFLVGGGLGIYAGRTLTLDDLRAPPEALATAVAWMERGIGFANSLLPEQFNIPVPEIEIPGPEIVVSEAEEPEEPPEEPEAQPKNSFVEQSVLDFTEKVQADLPLQLSPGVELTGVSANEGSMQLEIVMSRAMSMREVELFAVTAEARTKRLLCDGVIDEDVRLINSREVPIWFNYLDSDGNVITRSEAPAKTCLE